MLFLVFKFAYRCQYPSPATALVVTLDHIPGSLARELVSSTLTEGLILHRGLLHDKLQTVLVAVATLHISLINPHRSLPFGVLLGFNQPPMPAYMYLVDGQLLIQCLVFR